MNPSQRPLDAAQSRLDTFIRTPDFSERHHRTIQAPTEAVWVAATSVTPAEIRLLMPLMTLRSLPDILRGRRHPKSFSVDDVSFLDAFAQEGFIELHRDAGVAAGRAEVIYGAAGRFWSPTRNSPVPLDAQSFAEHVGPGTVKVAFSLQVVERGSSTLAATETRVVGTDPAAHRAFGRYWLVIRGPSGLIRRSWLAAIDRRARRTRF